MFWAIIQNYFAASFINFSHDFNFTTAIFSIQKKIFNFLNNLWKHFFILRIPWIRLWRFFFLYWVSICLHITWLLLFIIMQRLTIKYSKTSNKIEDVVVIGWCKTTRMNLYLRKKINWLISLLILMFSQMSCNFNLIFLLYIIILICDLHSYVKLTSTRSKVSLNYSRTLRIVFVLIHICSDPFWCFNMQSFVKN